MYSPLIQAFNIKYPWRAKGTKLWPQGYRSTFITIWHVDPENHQGKCNTRGDDSCGWFNPPYSQETKDKVLKLANSQYPLFVKGEHKFNCHEAIYWCWRAIKYYNKQGWQYGDKKPALSALEQEYIWRLSSNPVDNLKYPWSVVKDRRSFETFFICIFNAFLRIHRPWYKHPRWHILHWKIQVHPWQQLKRKYWDKCYLCEKRGFKGGQAIGNWAGDKIWHAGCENIKNPNTSTNSHLTSF